MSSTPVVPKPATPTTPISTVTQDIAWIRGHVITILLVVGLIVGGILGGIDVVESIVEKHDAAVAAATLKKESVDTSAQAALLAELAQEHADNVQRDAQQAALIQSLVAQMASQRAATAKQVATDNTLSAVDAATRLAQQTKAAPGDVTAVNNEVTLSLPITRQVVSDLDLLTQAQSDVTNLTGQLSAQNILTSDTKVELATANQVIAADKTELIATIKADNASCIASTKIAVDAEAKKGRKRTFWGTVLGVIGGVLLVVK
jgi:hypothetical protein